MRIYRYYNILIILLVSLTIASCTKQSDMITNELGFQFKRCRVNSSAVQVRENDIVYGQMKILLNGKQELYNNYNEPKRLFTVSQAEKNSIDEFLLSLHIGDSVLMVLPGDTIEKYVKNYHSRPQDRVYIYLTITQLISMQELSDTERQTMERKATETQDLALFVQEKYPSARKMSSGLYYWNTYSTSGAKATWGKRLYVSYTVRDTNGRVFDTNVEAIAKREGIYSQARAYKIFDFVLGDDGLIAGWSEALSYMRSGESCKAIIPSDLAYGASGYGNIPPFTPLVFDITLHRITDE